MTKIASLTPKIPRGKIVGKVTDGPPLTEAEHFWKCEACGGWFDMRDLGGVLDHEGPLPCDVPFKLPITIRFMPSSVTISPPRTSLT
jgi:hypothetical protein